MVVWKLQEIQINSMHVYKNILEKAERGHKMFAVLIDPEGLQEENMYRIISEAQSAHADIVLIGGSMVNGKSDPYLIERIKEKCSIPCVLFPGQAKQLYDMADALLLLSLISGRNPEYLIGKHVESAMAIKEAGMEVIPTGYILVDGGSYSSVQYITQSIPIPADKFEIASATALAGQLLGMKLVYLEAGSGARKPVLPGMIREVRRQVSIPIIVGGGIKTPEQAREAALAGADLIVIGNAIQDEQADIYDFSTAVHALNQSVRK